MVVGAVEVEWSMTEPRPPTFRHAPAPVAAVFESLEEFRPIDEAVVLAATLRWSRVSSTGSPAPTKSSLKVLLARLAQELEAVGRTSEPLLAEMNFGRFLHAARAARSITKSAPLKTLTGSSLKGK